MSVICPPDKLSFILNTSEMCHVGRILNDNCISWLGSTSLGSFVQLSLAALTLAK